MAWSTSDRTDRLPSDWPTLKADTKARARNRCEAHRHHPRCDGTGHDAAEAFPWIDPEVRFDLEPCVIVT